MLILAFHTATTGLIKYKDEDGVSIRSADPRQPHIVRLAAILFNTETEEVEQSMDVIVAPDGWESDPGAISSHGIDNERAIADGISEEDALEQFMALYKSADLRIAHSIQFFNRIIRIALKRFMPDLIPDEEWKDKALFFCTQQNSGGGGKKLADVFQFHTGQRLTGPNDSMRDADACLRIYRKIKDI